MGKLFSWGACSHGQLGIGVKAEMFATPQPVSFGQPNQIKMITGGGGHTLVLVDPGELYVCGWNHKGQLGDGTQDDSLVFSKLPQEFFENKSIRTASCGWDTSAVICDNDTLFVWGSNAYGQLGQSNKQIKYLAKPTKLELPFKDEAIRDIKFGLRHTCILTSGGIYLFGLSRHFAALQLWTTIEHNSCSWTYLKDSQIASISCGQNHLIYLQSAKNCIYGLGDNKHGQCDEQNLKNEICKISCGWTHNGVLSTHDKLLLYGRNNYGQLGSNELNIKSSTLNSPERIKDFHLGSEHGLAVTESGTLLTWGWNEHGSCGNDSCDNVFDPYTVNLPGKVILAGCGAGYSFALVDDDAA